MADTKIVNISGVARPSRKLRRMAAALHGNRMADAIDSMVEDAKVVDALAGAIDRALLHATSKDGRIDLKEAALHMLGEMRRNQHG
jgi:hypothetical protein